MSPWNALPWNTIVAIIGISILIPSLLAIILIWIKRFEDLGMAIGVFLLILGGVSYAYLIPQDVVHEAMLPENYIWEDHGTVHYWERNSVLIQGKDLGLIPFNVRRVLPERSPIERNFLAKEVIHISKLNSENNKALIHDVIYDDTGDVLSVINKTEKVSEWYWVDSHTASLKYVNVNAGRMGIPSDLNGANSVEVGWVESHGEEGSKENVVFVRDMQRIKTGSLDGVEVTVWQSNIYNKPVIWHGEPYFCDETLQLTVNPTTGYVVHVYRHLVLSAHLSQFLQMYYPEALHFRVVTNYLKLSDPIGEAAELIYNTTADSQSMHLAEARDLSNLITYVPLGICIPMFLVGIALTWRYCGRSYYWKQYKEYEQKDDSSQRKTKRRWSRIKIYAVGICIILFSSSFGYIVYQGSSNQREIMQIPTVNENTSIPRLDETPTPPGSDRAIDSGRHILLPTDEGVHKLCRREWWYFNVFFNDPNSDLQQYSLIVSFNKMMFNDIRFLKPDNLFIILYDDTGMSYDFATLKKQRGTLQSDGPGVDITFENSWAKGTYPSWHIHAVNEAKGFVADLDFTADFLPVWVEGRSANLPFTKFIAGDYYIPRCTVIGNISWNKKMYHVGGIGYHDHVWENNIPRFITKGWDWCNLHFDNGWEMYMSKFILRTPRNRYSGSIVISPNNRNLTEFNKFIITYTETASPKDLPFMTYPKKYHLEAQQDDMVLKLDVEIYNTCEIVWKGARTGMFEGPCYVKGTFSWTGHTVELNGYGISEITRVKYLFELPGIFNK
jgi:predicted secreted hydrolase